MKVLVLFFFLIGIFLIPINLYAQSSEEKAVYNLNQAISPQEIISDKVIEPDKNILDKLLADIKNILGLFFNAGSGNAQKIFAHSETLNNSTVPEEVQPESTESAVDQEKKFLGTQTGIYGISTPEFRDLPEEKRDIKSDEVLYERSTFPDKICPITGQC